MKRARLLGVLALVTLALAGCGGNAPSMLDAHGKEAHRIAGVWWLMFGLATGVYVVVAAFIVIAIVRGRKTEHGRPSRISDHAFVWVGGIGVPVVILLVIAVATVQTTAALRKPAHDPVKIAVRAHDWWWEVRYADGSRSANEIHVPTGQPIEVRLTSADVVHSFWVPQIAGKMDVIPGQTNVLRFSVDRPGTYRGMCAEFCGIEHANMAFRLVAQSPGLFERWLVAHRQPPREPASELAARGQVLFQRQPCAGCHTVRGTQAQGRVGPDLTDLGSRQTLGAGVLENTRTNLERWMRDAPEFKPGTRMPPIDLSPDDAAAIAAYLESLR